MSSLPDTVVLHLGAHKTASTHLQQSIMRAGPLPGVTFYGPDVLRGRRWSLQERVSRLTKTSQDGARRALVRFAAGQGRLVISDENFAGPMQMGWGRIPMPLYPRAAERVTTFCAAVAQAGGPPVDLCLGIRDPAGFLTSAYSQVLRGKRVVLPEKFIAKNPIEGVDWVEYLRRLRDVEGVGRLTVWRQDDYNRLFKKVCRIVVGIPPVTPATGRVHQRLSQTALEAVLLAKAQGLPNMVAEAMRTHPVTDDNPPFALFGPEEVERAAAFYEGQCALLAETPGITLLSA